MHFALIHRLKILAYPPYYINISVSPEFQEFTTGDDRCTAVFSQSFSVAEPIIIDPFSWNDGLEQAFYLFETRVQEQQPKFVWFTLTDDILPVKWDRLTGLVKRLADFQDTHGGYMYCTGPTRSPMWGSRGIRDIIHPFMKCLPKEEKECMSCTDMTLQFCKICKKAG